jgi:hypothetical protein
MKTKLTRRQGIASASFLMGLPFLESFAATEKPAKRMVSFFVPNGVILDAWRIEKTGKLDGLSRTLKPLESVKSSCTLFTGLSQRKAFANGDGAGDHARSNATFLTGAQAQKVGPVKLGQSFDQLAVDHLGKKTVLPSLELSTSTVRQGGCDSGYSCAYVNNISWHNETTPAPPIYRPDMVLDRIIGGGQSNSAMLQMKMNASILDSTLKSVKRLKGKMSYADHQRLDEYFTSIREIEGRLKTFQKMKFETQDWKIDLEYEKHSEYMELMMDMLVLAFKSDVTRISSFQMACGGSNRTFKEIGITERHHTLSHHRGDERKMEVLRKIDHYYVQRLAYFLNRLKSEKVQGESLLDHTMVVYGSGISNGDRHNHNDLPIIVAGNFGDKVKMGQHIKLNKEVPMANLFVSMLNEMGVKTNQFADSNGLLKA